MHAENTEQEKQELLPEVAAQVEEIQEASAQAEAATETQVAVEEADAPTESQEPKVELTDAANQIMDSIKSLTVLELSNLVKALEDEFGVSAQPTMVAGAGFAGPGAGAGATVEEEEKTSFDVVLTAVGDKKIQVIKEIRSVTALGLKEAKELVESAPKAVKEGASKEEAEEIKTKLEAVGATIVLK